MWGNNAHQIESLPGHARETNNEPSWGEREGGTELGPKEVRRRPLIPPRRFPIDALPPFINLPPGFIERTHTLCYAEAAGKG